MSNYFSNDAFLDIHLFNIDAATGAISFKNDTLLDINSKDEYRIVVRAAAPDGSIGYHIVHNGVLGVEPNENYEFFLYHLSEDSFGFDASKLIPITTPAHINPSIDENAAADGEVGFNYYIKTFVGPNETTGLSESVFDVSVQVNGMGWHVDTNKFDFDIVYNEDVGLFQLVAVAGSVFDYDEAFSYDLAIHIKYDGVYDYIYTTVNINDPDPEISVTTEFNTALTENIEIAKEYALYTASADQDVTWSLDSGDDEPLFEIDANGNVTFKADTTPDYETKPNYDFTIIATGASADLVSKQDVTVYVSDVDETGDNFDDLSATGLDVI